MSTTNTTLDDFRDLAADDESSDPGERPNWTPAASAETTHTCQNCNSHVSSEIVRVWGDNQNQLHHCLNCVTATAMKNLAGARPDYQPEQDAAGDDHDDLNDDNHSDLPDYMLPSDTQQGGSSDD